MSLSRDVEADVDYYVTRCSTKRLAVWLTTDTLERWSADFSYFSCLLKHDVMCCTLYFIGLLVKWIRTIFIETLDRLILSSDSKVSI